MSDMLMEAIAATGQVIMDKLDQKQTWCPEANKYSRAFNLSVLMPLIASDLKPADIFLLFTLIDQMNAENKVGSKIYKQLNMSRTTLWRAKESLEKKYCIFEFPDGSIMVNPNIAVLSKYRKTCMKLKYIWQTKMKEITQMEDKCPIQT